MEKSFIRFQLFADDSASGAGDSATERGSSADHATQENQAEQQEKQKENQNERKYTDKDVDEILNKKFAKWQERQQKAVDEAKKLAEMNAQQKAEYERDQLQKQLDDYKRRDSLSEMSKTARKMLSDSGISIPDDLLSMLVTTEAEETKSNVDSFAKLFSEAVESAVKARVKGEPPRKGSTGGTTMTKDQIMAIRDPELRQQKMLENKTLFNF